MLCNSSSWTSVDYISKLNDSACRDIKVKGPKTRAAKQLTDDTRVEEMQKKQHVKAEESWYLPDGEKNQILLPPVLHQQPSSSTLHEHDQDKSPLIANCVILLFHINSSPTGYFSLLSGKHLSTWNYYSAGASGGAQTEVNLAELWQGLCSLDGQSTGRAEGPNPRVLY